MLSLSVCNFPFHASTSLVLLHLVYLSLTPVFEHETDTKTRNSHGTPFIRSTSKVGLLADVSSSQFPQTKCFVCSILSCLLHGAIGSWETMAPCESSGLAAGAWVSLRAHARLAHLDNGVVNTVAQRCVAQPCTSPTQHHHHFSHRSVVWFGLAGEGMQRNFRSSHFLSDNSIAGSLPHHGSLPSLPYTRELAVPSDTRESWSRMLFATPTRSDGIPYLYYILFSDRWCFSASIALRSSKPPCVSSE